MQPIINVDLNGLGFEMAGETNLLTGRSLREKKRSYKDFLTEDELEDELDIAEQNTAQNSHKVRLGTRPTRSLTREASLHIHVTLRMYLCFTFPQDSNTHFKKRKHPGNNPLTLTHIYILSVSL